MTEALLSLGIRPKCASYCATPECEPMRQRTIAGDRDAGATQNPSLIFNGAGCRNVINGGKSHSALVDVKCYHGNCCSSETLSNRPASGAGTKICATRQRSRPTSRRTASPVGLARRPGVVRTEGQGLSALLNLAEIAS